MNDIMTAVSTVGFPTVVSFYLLVRFESKISILSDSILSLEKSIEKMCDQKK